MRILSVILILGLIVFTCYQIVGLVHTIKEKKKASVPVKDVPFKDVPSDSPNKKTK